METGRTMQRIAQICHQVMPGQPRTSRRDGTGVDLRMGIEGVPTLGVGLPALDIELAFPQATPASKFPPSVSDFYQLNDLLSEEERAIRDRVRSVMEKEVAPVIAKYWERAEFPFELLPAFAKLNVSGGTIKGYGCPGMSILSSALVNAEIARVDASCSTFMMVHTCLGMLTIGMLASEEQKHRWLPPLARLDHVSCWLCHPIQGDFDIFIRAPQVTGLTEPAYGSDASSLNTIATKVDGGWHLNGQKRWIGNATFADILVIFARNAQTNQINGFVVKKGAKGLSATKIENKIGLRIVQNGDIVLTDVFVPDDDRIANLNSFQDTSKVLAVSRVMVAWQPIGISMGVYDVCHRYLLERKQFGQPLAALQINQEKLVRMLGHVQAMFLMGWRLCKLYDAGKMTPGHASLAKSWNTKIAREVVALGRELLGGNGILSDFNVAKAFCDLEPIYTYEGTYEVNSLVTGREVTGIASIKPPVSSSNKKRL